MEYRHDRSVALTSTSQAPVLPARFKNCWQSYLAQRNSMTTCSVTGFQSCLITSHATSPQRDQCHSYRYQNTRHQPPPHVPLHPWEWPWFSYLPYPLQLVSCNILYFYSFGIRLFGTYISSLLSGKIELWNLQLRVVLQVQTMIHFSYFDGIIE